MSVTVRQPYLQVIQYFGPVTPLITQSTPCTASLSQRLVAQTGRLLPFACDEGHHGVTIVQLYPQTRNYPAWGARLPWKVPVGEWDECPGTFDF